MESPSPPNKPPSELPVTMRQLVVVFLVNDAVCWAWWLLVDRPQFPILLWLPLLNLLVGLVLQATRYAQLGRVMMLLILVVGLIGLGTCALLATSLR